LHMRRYKRPASRQARGRSSDPRHRDPSGCSHWNPSFQCDQSGMCLHSNSGVIVPCPQRVAHPAPVYYGTFMWYNVSVVVNAFNRKMQCYISSSRAPLAADGRGKERTVSSYDTGCFSTAFRLNENSLLLRKSATTSSKQPNSLSVFLRL